MARIPPLVIPTGHVPPSRRCEECAVSRQEATEAQTRKRSSRKREEVAVEDLDESETPVPTPEADSLNP